MDSARPAFGLYLFAASAVRTFARVDADMPKKPASIEQSPPLT